MPGKDECDGGRNIGKSKSLPDLVVSNYLFITQRTAD